jgi:acyl-CoA thioesterase FadM
VPWSELNASGHDMVLARIEIDFRSSGRFGEVLVTGARVKRIGNSSLVFELRTWEESSGRTVAEAVQVQVIVDHATFKPVPVPSFLSDAVVRSQEPPPEQEG